MKNIKTIIIEDNPLVLSINCRFLEKVGGFEIIDTEKTGKNGIDKIKLNNYDLILLDMYIPELNGLEVAKEIRKCNIPTDIILITAATDPELLVEFLNLDVVDYILKPYNFTTFSISMNRYKDLFSLNRVT